MNIATVADGIATRLQTITGLRVHAYVPDNINPPAAVVGLPDRYDFDLTYGRGGDTVVFPVWVLVGRVTDRSSRGNLAIYLDGSASTSVKAAIEGGSLGGGSDSARVTNAEILTMSEAGVEFLAAKFFVEVIG